MNLQHKVYPIVLGSVGYLGALRGASISVSYGTHRLIHAAEWDRHRSCGDPKIAVSLVVNPSLRSCTDWMQWNSVWQSAQASFRLPFLRTTVHCGHYGPRALIHHCSLLPVNGRISKVYYLQYARTSTRDAPLFYVTNKRTHSTRWRNYDVKIARKQAVYPPPILPGPYFW